MYEFTFGGAWFKWSALDHTSKRWAAASLGAAMLAAIPLGMAAGNYGYALGFRLGYAISGGHGTPVHLPASYGMAGWMGLWIVAWGIVSAAAWWRFSRRQDEMFNRVQNWALGMSGGWTMALMLGWAVLAMAGLVPPVSPLALFLIFYGAALMFWFVAVRRWL